MSETAFDRCPRNHKLPRSGCSPLFCADEEVGAREVETDLRSPSGVRKSRPKRGARAPSDKDADAAVAEVAALAPGSDGALQTVQSEVERLQVERARHLARAKFSKLPDGLAGAEAEEWADRKMVELLPLAMMELEHSVKFGSPEQRERARREILDATGRGKRTDGPGNFAPVIVIQGGNVQVPWAPKPKAGVTVEPVETKRPQLSASVDVLDQDADAKK